MDALTLDSDKSSRISTLMRLSAGTIGILLIMLSVYQHFAFDEPAFWTGFNFAVGVGFILSALFNTSLNNPPSITLNDDFMRTEESPSFIRTAYWNRIHTLTLTRLSVRIKYQSGSPERFRLPYLSNEEFEDLQKWLHQTSTENDITFTQKAWWKPF